MVGLELDELDRVAERVEREESQPPGDLAIVVAGGHRGRLEVPPKLDDIVDLEARVPSRLRVHRDAVGLLEEVELLVPNPVPQAAARKLRRARKLLEPEEEAALVRILRDLEVLP